MGKSKKCPTCNGSGYVKSAKAPTKKPAKLDRACTGFDIRSWLKEEKAKEAKATEDYYNRPDIKAICEDNNRRSNLPPEDPEHICGMFCDGQDGGGSDCAKIRCKLFGQWHLTDDEIKKVKLVGTASCYYCGEPVSNTRHRETLDACPDDKG